MTARELTDIMYEIDKQQANVHAELTFMEQQRLVIKSGSSAPYGYSVVSNVGTPQYFYVFQNQSFGEESKGEYLQALKQAKDGTENHHWSRLKEVKKGDVIFHGYKQHVVAVSTAKTDAYGCFRFARFLIMTLRNQLCLYLKIWKTLRIAVRMLMRNI